MSHLNATASLSGKAIEIDLIFALIVSSGYLSNKSVSCWRSLLTIFNEILKIAKIVWWGQKFLLPIYKVTPWNFRLKTNIRDLHVGQKHKRWFQYSKCTVVCKILLRVLKKCCKGNLSSFKKTYKYCTWNIAQHKTHILFVKSRWCTLYLYFSSKAINIHMFVCRS